MRMFLLTKMEKTGKMERIKLCFATMEGSPEFLGGASLFYKNLINYIHSNHKNISVFWVYFGNENKVYLKDNINYIELKFGGIESPLLLKKSIIMAKFFEKNYFDIISTMWGIWTRFYKKKEKQRLIQELHGTMYYFNKNHFRKFSLIKKIMFSPLLLISWFVDKSSNEIDKLICVSEKVKKQAEKLYGKRKNTVVIRTGVDLTNFKPKNKNQIKKIRKELHLEEDKIYGLHIGRGGFWTKGLDRAVRLSEEMYKLNQNYRLIVIGPDFEKVRHLIDKKFVIFLENIPREKMPYYYNASDVFFCFSRYEGGAPTLVVSEAMASGCPVVCARSAQQEIIENEKNGLIIENFEEREAKEIYSFIKGIKKMEKIIENALETVKNLSLEKWGKKYLGELLDK
jgi:glycosyltransferase involved in cell wall biosynthesis